MNEDKKNIVLSQKIGKVFPYYIELDSNIRIDPKEKMERFQGKEWNFNPSNYDFSPGFGKAELVDDIVFVEYVEMEKTRESSLGILPMLNPRKCAIFDMLGNRSSGILLLNPNYITENEIHLKRYLGRLQNGNRNFQINPAVIEEDVLRNIFSSRGIEKKGIKFKKNSTKIEFSTSTTLENNEYYKICADFGIENEKIDKIRIKLLDPEKGYSPEVVIYTDRLVFDFNIRNKENWRYVKILLRMLKLFDFEKEYGGDAL